MKTYILIIISICTNLITAQKSLDTIYANEQKNVALFFPNPIRQGITGSSHFVFTYNREKQQYFGLLQAQPGIESNLLAITNDGQVYTYILKYSNKLSKLNYFVAKDESIGNEKPEVIKEKLIIKPIKKPIKRTKHFQKFSEYLLHSKSDHIKTKHKKGIKLRLQKIVYSALEVYLVLEVENKSGIDFEVDFLNIYRTNGNKRRKASYQKLQFKVLYKHKMPSVFKDKLSERFVYLLPKIVLGDNEELMIELKEFKGNRKVILETKL